MSRIDKRMTVHARLFHENLCIDLGIDTMKVLVFRELPDFLHEPPSTTGLMFLDDEYILIFFDVTKEPLEKLLRTVAHETYHAYQVQKGLIRQIDEEWYYIGTPMREIKKMPWASRPHEIEAESYAKYITSTRKGARHDERLTRIKSKRNRKPSKPQTLRSTV